MNIRLLFFVAIGMALFLSERYVEAFRPPSKEGKAYLHLVQNYSDYGGEPLRLFFKADSINPHGGKGVWHEKWGKKRDIYQEILSKYPNARISGYIQFLLADAYQPYKVGRFYGAAQDSVIQLMKTHFKKVIMTYPDAEFPVRFNSLSFPYNLGPWVKIAPFAYLELALISYPTYVSTDTSLIKQKEVEGYFYELINKFPNERDGDNNVFAVSAYVNLLLCFGQDKRFATNQKAKQLCETLLTQYKNQPFYAINSKVGSSHPEALMILAEIEHNPEEKLELYKRIALDFSGYRTGELGRCVAGSYYEDAFSAIARCEVDKQKIFAAYKEIIYKHNTTETAGFWFQYQITSVYAYDFKEYDTAIIEAQKLIDNLPSFTFTSESDDGEPPVERTSHNMARDIIKWATEQKSKPDKVKK